jgi:hypothetical protein
MSCVFWAVPANTGKIVLMLNVVAKNSVKKNGFVVTNFLVLEELSVMGCPQIGCDTIYGISVKIQYLIY